MIRLRCGSFDIRDAISVSQLEEAFRHGYWQHLVYPIDTVLLQWETMIVNNTTGQIIRDGRPVVLENGEDIYYHKQNSKLDSSSGNRCRVYNLDGCFLGMLCFNSEREQWAISSSRV